MRFGKEVTPMAKIMQCDCGHVVRGETDDELVANVQNHAREVHDMEITREQVLAMAQHE
jgi:predicted small metal-binding protein